MFRKNFESAAHYESATVPDVVPTDAHPNLQGIRVLVADDERDARQLIATALECCGAKVATAFCADDASAQAFRQKFDVIISDLAMPGGDGISLVKRLRLRGDRTPAIALSAMRGETVEKAVRDAGFTQHVDKPVELTFLAAAVADVVWRSRQGKTHEREYLSQP